MNTEEKQLIQKCRVIIVDSGNFINYVESELNQLGLDYHLHCQTTKSKFKADSHEIIIEYTGCGTTLLAGNYDIPIIYPFDFIAGAAAIVVFREDDRSWLNHPNLRIWVAEYVAGYCAFWNVEDCRWLYDSLPLIRENKTSESALKTAAYICARIAANIAVGRDVKHYPRFYLAESGE